MKPYETLDELKAIAEEMEDAIGKAIESLEAAYTPEAGRKDMVEAISEALDILSDAQHFDDDDDVDLNFSPLGDPAKIYPLELTEPEINVMYAAFDFITSNQNAFSGITQFFDHYEPEIAALVRRLAPLNDGNAPIEAPAPSGESDPAVSSKKKGGDLDDVRRKRGYHDQLQ